MYKAFLKFELMCVLFTLVAAIGEFLHVGYWYEVFLWLLLAYPILNYLPRNSKPYLPLLMTMAICYITRGIGIPLIMDGYQNIIEQSEYSLMVNSLTKMIVQTFLLIYTFCINYVSAMNAYKALKDATTYGDIRMNKVTRAGDLMRGMNIFLTSISLICVEFVYGQPKLWMSTFIFVFILIMFSFSYTVLIEKCRNKKLAEILKLNE